MADKRIAPGVYKTPHGYRVMVRIGTKIESKRFPPTYTLEALKHWRDEHKRLRKPFRAARGTFAADVQLYLRAVEAMPTYTDRVREISAWLPLFGTKARWNIRPDQIRAELARWRSEDYAPNTCNHRRSALSHLYSVLDGKAAYNPVRDVPQYKLAPPLKYGLPLLDCLKVLRHVKGKMTRARLLVLLWTGMRPSELKRVSADDVDVVRGRCYVRTAKGGPAREIALNKSAVKAFKLFSRREAWGEFSVQSTRKRSPPQLRPRAARRRRGPLGHSGAARPHRHQPHETLRADRHGETGKGGDGHAPDGEKVTGERYQSEEEGQESQNRSVNGAPDRA
jgi:integrase